MAFHEEYLSVVLQAVPSSTLRLLVSYWVAYLSFPAAWIPVWFSHSIMSMQERDNLQKNYSRLLKLERLKTWKIRLPHWAGSHKQYCLCYVYAERVTTLHNQFCSALLQFYSRVLRWSCFSCQFWRCVRAVTASRSYWEQRYCTSKKTGVENVKTQMRLLLQIYHTEMFTS